MIVIAYLYSLCYLNTGTSPERKCHVIKANLLIQIDERLNYTSAFFCCATQFTVASMPVFSPAILGNASSF